MDEEIHKDLLEEHQIILTKIGASLFRGEITFEKFYEKIAEEKKRFESVIEKGKSKW